MMSISPKFNDELQAALDNFMQLLQEDLHKFLGEGASFIAKVNIELGTAVENRYKLEQYQKKVQKLVDSVPKEFKPRVVK